MKDNPTGRYSRGLLVSQSMVMYLFLAFSGQDSCAITASEVRNLSEKTVEVGRKAQETHEDWMEEEHRLRIEIEDLNNRLSRLQWQRKKIQVYRLGLEEKITDLEKKEAVMEAVNLELLPVLESHLDKLKQGLVIDIPGNLTERRKSLLQAHAVLNDFDKGLLDKTRAVLDAVAREVDFGHRVDVQEDEIDLEGTCRRVKLLQVGRVGLYAMTLDGENAYYWDRNNADWVVLEKNAGTIHEAIEMAEGIRLVGLSKLPVEFPAALAPQEDSK